MAARLALHVAALRGDAGKVRNLLLFGAAVDQRNDAGCRKSRCEVSQVSESKRAKKWRQFRNRARTNDAPKFQVGMALGWA